jgi:hypothetical protein
LEARFIRFNWFLRYDLVLRHNRFLSYHRFFRYSGLLHHRQNLWGRLVFHNLHLGTHFLWLGQRVPSGSRIDSELRCYRQEKSPSEEECGVQCY